VINIKNVTGLDPQGVSILISSLTNLRKHNGGLKLVNVTPATITFLNEIGLTRFFDIFEDEFEAIYSFSINAI
ncbi:MAG: STAS domain-containing protein, partial [Nitrospinae bacterium]|nr:STAS domain-containing protein [Nitrospinota bacterium]